MSSRMIEILLLILILHKVSASVSDTYESVSCQPRESWIHMKACHASPASVGYT